MYPAFNSWLAAVHVLAGLIAVAIMLDLKGCPKDRPYTRQMVWAHRVSGYLFVVTFCFMLVTMIKKVGAFQDEVTARMVWHIVLAVALVPLIALKILIVRKYRLWTGHLLFVGTIIFTFSLTLNALTAGYYFLHSSDIRYVSVSVEDSDILDEETGRYFVFKRCGKCHSVERVFQSFKSAEGWSNTANRMARIDAPNIRPFEVKQIIHYLIRQQARRRQSNNSQVGKEIGQTLLNRKCTACHDLERIIQASKTEAQWQATVNRMIDNTGDPEFLTPEETSALVRYLATR